MPDLTKNPDKIVPQVVFALPLPHSFEQMALQSVFVTGLLGNETLMLRVPSPLACVSMSASSRVLETLGVVHCLVSATTKTSFPNLIDAIVRFPTV